MEDLLVSREQGGGREGARNGITRFLRHRRCTSMRTRSNELSPSPPFPAPLWSMERAPREARERVRIARVDFYSRHFPRQSPALFVNVVRQRSLVRVINR